jgi:DNA-binding IscR family transcriptional regulator
MVLDGPAHCALSVMTLIAVAGPSGPRTAHEIAAELDMPIARVNRALRDLTAAHLLYLDLAPSRIGYAPQSPPSHVTIADIIQAAARNGDALGSQPHGPSGRARRGLLAALARVTLSDVLLGQVRRADH